MRRCCAGQSSSLVMVNQNLSDHDVLALLPVIETRRSMWCRIAICQNSNVGCTSINIGRSRPRRPKKILDFVRKLIRRCNMIYIYICIYIYIYIWRFPEMGGTRKPSILFIGFCSINHPFRGYLHLVKPPSCISMHKRDLC